MEADETALCKLYGLTRGEAALAAILSQGKSIDAAAEALCISSHTARTHLRRILMKMDSHGTLNLTSALPRRRMPKAKRPCIPPGVEVCPLTDEMSSSHSLTRAVG